MKGLAPVPAAVIGQTRRRNRQTAAPAATSVQKGSSDEVAEILVPRRNRIVVGSAAAFSLCGARRLPASVPLRITVHVSEAVGTRTQDLRIKSASRHFWPLFECSLTLLLPANI